MSEDSIEDLSYSMHLSCERIATVLRNYDLFVFEDNFFYSNRLMEHINIRNNKKDLARKSAEVRRNNANALPTHSERNAKERKGKERKEDKEEEIKSQKKLFGKYVAMEEKEYKKLVEKYGAMYIGKKIAALDSYIADWKGKKYKDHYLTINKRSLWDMPEVWSLGEEYLKAIEGKNTAAKTRLENTHSKEKCVREMKTFLAGSFA